MARTLEQKIATIDAQITRLRTQNRKLETGQKIVLGGMLLNAAKQNANVRAWVLQETERSITRDIDKRRLAPLLKELLAMENEQQ